MKKLKQLEKKLGIKIGNAKDMSGVFGNRYSKDENGNITMLQLEKLPIDTLDVLQPFAEHLKELTIDKCNLKTLQGLKNFTQIEVLNFYKNPFDNIDEVGALSNLKDFYLQSDTISKIENLEHINLETISFWLKNKQNLNDICKIPSIKKFNVGSYSKVNTKSINDKFPFLEELKFSNDELKKIPDFEGFYHLKELKIFNCYIRKIENLDNLISLKKLSMIDNNIKKIEGLEQLINLKELNLTMNKITEISGLQNLQKLERLYIPRNRIKKIDTLPKSLKELYMPYNSLAKLNENMTELEKINLCGNKIKRLPKGWLNKIRKNCEIDMRFNDITTINDVIPENLKVMTGEEGEAPYYYPE